MRVRGVAAGVVALLVSLTAASGAAAQAYETNDSFITGFGPISAGTTYSAGTETDNDEDFYFFYVPQRAQMFFTLTATNTVSSSSRVCAEVTQQENSGYSRIDNTGLDVYEGESQTAAVTLDRGKYYFTVLDYCSEAGETYTFQVTPAGSTSTYEPFASACAAAHGPVVAATDALKAAQAGLSKARRRLALARARRAPRSRIRTLKRRVSTARTRVRVANTNFRTATAAENEACSVPM